MSVPRPCEFPGTISDTCGARTRPNILTHPTGKEQPSAMKAVGSGLQRSKEDRKVVQNIVGDLKQMSMRPKTKGSFSEKKEGSSCTTSPKKKAKTETSPLVAPIQSLVVDLQQFGAEDAVVDVLLTSIMGNLQCPEVVDFCFFVLFEMALKNAEQKHVIVSKGALKILIQAMAASPSKAALQEHGCGIIWALSIDEQYRPAIVAAGGCYQVVDALRRHEDKVTVVDICFGAIKVLSMDSGGRNEFKKNDASQTVAFAMMTNASSAMLQSIGCSVLSNLAVDLILQEVSIVSVEEINAILESMKRHPDVAAVQKQACFTLNDFTFSDRNCETLAHSVLPSRDLLCHAVRKFPQECRRDAQIVLQRLEKCSPISTFKQANKEAGLAAADELMDRAVLAGKRGEYELAQSQFEEALRLKRSFCKPTASNSELVHCLNCIGYVMGIQSNMTGAIEKYKESLSIQQSICSSDAEASNISHGLARTMSTIGLLYMKCCDHHNAEKYFTKALREKKRIYGKLSGNIDAAEDLEYLGDLKRIRGKHKEAEEFYIISASCYKNSDLASHEREISNVISKLNTVSKLGHSDEFGESGACDMFELTTEMKGAADVLTKLGHFAGKRKDFAFAQDCFQKALEMKKKAYESQTLKKTKEID